jgi:outer membrane biosynthesis protein TonB
VLVAVDANKYKNVTFLALPPDLQKPTRKPNTNIESDKDRVAMSRHPELDPKELRKILASPPPGLPGMTGPRSAPPPQPMAQSQPAPPQPQMQPPQGQPAPRPQFDSNQTAQLQAPPRPNNSFAKYAAGMTPGQAIQQAAQGAAANRAGGGGQAGDFGLGTGAHGRAQGSFEVLSDTLGVDFVPYLARIRTIIEMHWYDSLPPSFYPPISKKGKLLIQFSILPDGKVAAMQLVATSDDTSLDRAAWGAITGSNPFPPLPEPYVKIGGRDLTLRCLFAYNLEEKDLQ